jgi:hypothetical protein
MKFTKLSLVTALAVSTAFAGGDIAPVEPTVETPVVETSCNSNTTLNAKAVAYYYTTDTNPNDMFSKENSQFGTAVTFDISHTLIDGITANFSAVGFANLTNDGGYMEGKETGAFINVANLTATFADTTLVLGRQLLDTPMLGSFDWLLAQSSFEAATLVNKSVNNLTLVASYVQKIRANNAGDNFSDDLDGDNFALGAAYSDAFSASVWYYNIDAAKYTQVYVDAGYDFGVAKVEGQYIATDYDTNPDATAYGLKISGKIANINLYAAYNAIQDANTGMIEVDSLYTSSWNTWASTVYNGEDVDAFKVGISTTFAGISAELSYADYDQGNETDLVLGYDVTDCINVGAVYTNTTPNVANADDVNALELFATYKF